MPTALITGGTAGIGAAFARALASRGHDLVLVARNADRLTETVIDLEATYGVSVETIAADLAAREDVLRVADRLSSTDQPVDLLVNNAGFGVPVALTASDLSPHEQAIDVMIRAVLLLGGAAGRAMKGRGSGAIINVSSTAGFVAMGGYSAIKAWVTCYTEGLAIELARHGVDVVALCPGWVRTEFHERADIKTSRIPEWMWLDVDELVAECLDGLGSGTVISIPSTRYKVLMGTAKVAPRRLIRSVSARMSAGRH